MDAQTPSSKRRCVVFDLDGTLVDSAGVIAEIINDMRVERGLPVLALDEVRPHVTAGGAAMADALLAGTSGDAREALAQFRERYGAVSTPPDSLYPGARQALTRLSGAGFRLAVFSNKTQALCEKVLGDLGVDQLLDAIIGTSAATPHKPDPTGYFQALDRAGGEVTRSCMVGDSNADEAVAHRVGVPFIFAAWGYGEMNGAHGGEACRAKSLADVPDLVARLAACAQRA